MARSVVVPKIVEPNLRKLFRLEDEQRSYLYSSLSKASPFYDDTRFLAQIDSDALGIDDDDKCQIIQALLSLSMGKYLFGMSLSEFVEGTVQYLLHDESLCEHYDSSLEEYYLSVLSLFLGLEQSIGAKAKAISLLLQHERLFTDAQTMTDFRPVFRDNIEEHPSGGVVLHNLCIDYRENEEDKHFYVTLDSNDINKLLDILKRSASKSRSLVSLMSDANVTILSDEE